jgi:hypothetical protein
MIDEYTPTAAVRWWFRNGHEWYQAFDSQAERNHWINRVGLVSHPDIVRVTVYDGDFNRDLKRLG